MCSNSSTRKQTLRNKPNRGINHNSLGECNMSIKVRTRPGETRQEAKARIIKADELQKALRDDLYVIFEEANHRLMSSSDVIPKLQELYRDKYSAMCEPGRFMQEVAFLASNYEEEHSRMADCFEEVVDFAEERSPECDDAVNVEHESEND